MKRLHEKDIFHILLLLLLTVFQSAALHPYGSTPAGHLNERASLPPTTIIQNAANAIPNENASKSLTASPFLARTHTSFSHRPAFGTRFPRITTLPSLGGSCTPRWRA